MFNDIIFKYNNSVCNGIFTYFIFFVFTTADRIYVSFSTAYYFGKTKVNTALNPKSGLLPDGAANGMRGPKATETACLPNFVTAETDGSREIVVVFASQLKFISELRDIPAPLFQLCERKGWKNIWLISLLFSSPAKDHNWFTKKP